MDLSDPTKKYLAFVVSNDIKGLYDDPFEYTGTIDAEVACIQVAAGLATLTGVCKELGFDIDEFIKEETTEFERARITALLAGPEIYEDWRHRR